MCNIHRQEFTVNFQPAELEEFTVNFPDILCGTLSYAASFGFLTGFSIAYIQKNPPFTHRQEFNLTNILFGNFNSIWQLCN